jgi:hypothetical protein
MVILLAKGAPEWPTWAQGHNEWRALHEFMLEKQQASPYPEYLYRYVIQRHDSLSRPTADIGSDAYEAFPMPRPIGKAHTDGTVPALFRELERQLAKYRNKVHQRASHKSAATEGPPSALVSLSGDFRWTVQKACKIYRASSETIVPGVAVIESARAKAFDSVLYRVSDLLEFFDKHYNKGRNPLAVFSDDIRYWAANADEYVAWSHVPRVALVSHVSISALAPHGELNFLTQNFRRSKDLAAVRHKRWVKISCRKYWTLAADFVTLFILGQRHELLVNEPIRLRVDILLDAMTCARQWGFFSIPPSKAACQRYKPATSRLLRFAETTALSDEWEKQMRDVAGHLKDMVSSSMQAMRELVKQSQKKKGPHHKMCAKCKWSPVN